MESKASASTPGICWYALQVRSRKENYIASQIAGQGYECLLPTYRSIRKWSDRVKELEQPLFPGYLFCRFDIHDRRPVITTPGVLQIVGSGRTADSCIRRGNPRPATGRVLGSIEGTLAVPGSRPTRPSALRHTDGVGRHSG